MQISTASSRVSWDDAIDPGFWVEASGVPDTDASPGEADIRRISREMAYPTTIKVNPACAKPNGSTNQKYTTHGIASEMMARGRMWTSSRNAAVTAIPTAQPEAASTTANSSGPPNRSDSMEPDTDGSCRKKS